MKHTQVIQMNTGQKTNYPKWRACKTNLLKRVEKVMKDLKRLFPNMVLDEAKVTRILARCRRHYEKNLYYGRQGVPENKRRQRKLKPDEMLIYNYIKNISFVENGRTVKVNPSSLYRNFLAIRIPEDLRDELVAGKLSQQQAIKLARMRKSREQFGKATVLLDMFYNEVLNYRW